MTSYGLFRLLHVVFAIIAMGPHFATIFMFRHMARNPESAPSLFPLLSRVMKFPKHGAMAMLATGVLMIAVSGSRSSFEQPWLAASLVLFLFNVIYGLVKLEPTAKRMGEALAAGPVKADQVGQLAKQMDSTFKAMTFSLVLIIVLMIYRPTL